MPPILQIQHLIAHHGTRKILNDISFSVHRGEVTVIVGANGCGKSTLLRCMARLHRPSSGQIQWGEKNLWHLSQRETAKQLALLPQSPQAPEGLSVASLVRFGRHPHQRLFKQWSEQDEVAVQEALRVTDTLALATIPLEQLSGGQRQRCWLAMTLAQDTPLLLLDEPTSMLDLGHQTEVLSLIRQLAQEGRSIIMVLHDLAAAASYADQLIAIEKGQLFAAGKPNEIVNAHLVKTLYGIDAHILYTPEDGAPIVVPRLHQHKEGLDVISR
jgi:iron complex transport system ATP-binding protein